ncbi:helicase required for RNAi-mediated heterochromatin assembly 1 [Coccidioides immitis H538.4]|uniref:Helicase required for RNAi-mediated heterochromatin assembly 1 n=1 Tax=Coccidioides immitis H538.4 TaxID=396776 RepID=A0A0J8REJ5_COCIT|nr:helicase required for RNAi-mediated heterochromatin assembly 1 [Coccidioides immitis H538.4]
MASRHFGLPHRGGTPTNEPASVPLNRSIGEYVKAASHVAESGSWTGKTEVPSSGEILGIDADINPGDAVFLLPNQINGPWRSREMYLKAHYELLREDAVAPLRDAVAYVRQDPRMQDTLDICIYEKVRIVGITCAQSGIAIRVQFSIARAGKNIVWEYSQRLTTGKIVALTPANDNFKSRCVVAVVAARPLEGLKSHPCQIDLFFANPDHAAFDYQQEWLMVESRNGYYEALRHTLLALQKMSKESFPLHEYICDLKHDVEPPEYVKRNPVIDASPLFPLANGVSHINMLREWPNPPKGLDTSQWGALQHILTKRLSVVQGPPGTGKTHVSVVAIRTLLSNIGPKDPPIIIAAQTNHALDQLLRHVSTFERNYVRVGGRSMDLEIRKRTVYELRKKYNIPFIPGGALGLARKQYRLLSDKVAELIQPFTLDRSGMPLQAALFLKLELITQSQHDSLLRGAEGWIHSGDEIDPVSAWLGEQMIKYDPTYKMENFGFVEDEIDLEYEQLKELEAEQGLDDDDYENLRGHYIALKEGFTGRTNLMLAGKTKRAKEIISEKLRSLMKEYNTTASNLKIGKWERDLIILRDARVIGMTTTGLSKYRALVSSLKPRIILVDEAAEGIETPVAAHTNGPRNPQDLTPIYDNLEDHEDVLNRPGVPGMGNVSSYFFCHSWPESSDSLLSKYNESEAKMVVGFYLYLYMNGIPAEDITVLTFYNGQRKKILKALKEVPLLQGQYSKVATVDSYQGEENEIVLLSLVRSGGRNIGFLSIENRVCVALSRAKRGFYIFGNAEALSIHNGLWWEIVQIMRKEPKRLGYYIPVTCAGHDKKTLVRDPETWKKLDGGCLSPCGASLDCGHKCPLRCHAFPAQSCQV